MFAFAKFDIGEAPVNVKVGQTTVYWGESLLLGGAIHGISYSQNPIDLWKGYATPGAEAKELFRPRVGFNVQSQVTDTVVARGTVFLQLAALREPGVPLPGGGLVPERRRPAALGRRVVHRRPNPFAALVPGAPTYLRLWRGKDILPDENTGNYGLSAALEPASGLDGTIGAYYRRTYDMQPQLMLTPGLAAVPAATCTAIGGQPVTPTQCIINTQATNVADLRSQGPLSASTTRPSARTSTSSA